MKKKLYTYIFITVLYVIIGIFGYFAIKYYFKPESDTFNTYIKDSVEIEDRYGLDHVLNLNDKTYALINGDFTCNDPINDAFLSGKFSYIDEEKIDNTNGDNIVTHTIKESDIFSIYDVTIENFDIGKISPTKIKSIKDIRNKEITYNYYVKSIKYYGTLLCEINEGHIKAILFYENENIKFIKDNVDNTIFTENGYLLIWALILFILLIGFDSDETDEEYKL